MLSFSPTARGWKRLLVADMDSTIIGQECIDELADFAGLKSEVAEITERAMQGEIEFSAALRERVQLLAGLEESVLGRCLNERVRTNPGAETLVQTMRARRRELIAGVRGLYCRSPSRSPAWSVSTGSAPTA